MNRQRGLAWWIYVAVAGAAVGALWLAVERFDGWVDELKAEAHKAGRKEALLEVAQRDNKQLADAQAELERLRGRVREQEAAHAAALAELDRRKTKEVRDAEVRKDRFVSDVVAGRIRLFDPGARQANGCGPGGDGAAQDTSIAAAGVGHGAGRAELSAELGAFLGREAGRADQVVLKLQACQAILVEDRKVFNGEDL